jgi:hypothetical protein
MCALALLAGCARSPEGVSITTPRELAVRIDFAGPINDGYFYFVPIDSTGGGDAPLPVFPGVVTGEAWVTGSATHYVEYHQRRYTVYRITSLQPFRSEPIGSPLRSTPPEPGGKSLSFTIDLNAIGAAGESIDLNIIAVDLPFAQVRTQDALGLQGTQYLPEVDITTDRTITNTEGGIKLEPEEDVLDQNQDFVPGQPNPSTQPLDISDWVITTDV